MVKSMEHTFEYLQSDSKDIAYVRTDGFMRFLIAIRTDLCPIVTDYILDHEYGHVYYGHIYSFQNKYDQLKKIIRTHSVYIKNSIKTQFPDYVIDENTFEGDMIRYILNVAGDLQINSTILNTNKCLVIGEDLFKLGLTNKPDSALYPSKFGITEIDNFEYYIQQVIINLPLFIEEEKESNLIQIFRTQSLWSCEGRSLTISKPSIEIKSTNSKVDLKYLLNSTIKTESSRFKKDLLYKHNRGLSTDILKPSYQVRRVLSTPRTTVLLDISGSMPAELVSSILGDIKLVLDSHEVNLNLVTCNTSVSKVFLDIEEIPKIKSGGGTSMVTGLKYIDKFIDNHGPIFIISDNDDDTESWDKFALSFTDKIISIKYGNFKNKYKFKNIELIQV